MWQIELPYWWHFVVRAIVVYVFLIVILRLTGKRQVGQLAPFDLVLLLVLSNAVQNSMNGGDNSLTGGLISATTLVGTELARRLGHLPQQAARKTHRRPADRADPRRPSPSRRPESGQDDNPRTEGRAAGGRIRPGSRRAIRHRREQRPRDRYPDGEPCWTRRAHLPQHNRRQFANPLDRTARYCAADLLPFGEPAIGSPIGNGRAAIV